MPESNHLNDFFVVIYSIDDSILPFDDVADRLIMVFGRHPAEFRIRFKGKGEVEELAANTSRRFFIPYRV